MTEYKSKKYHITLRPVIAKKLDEYIELTGLAPSAVTTLAIAEFLQKEDSAASVFRHSLESAV